MATTVLNSWRSWAHPLSLGSTTGPTREDIIGRDRVGQQDRVQDSAADNIPDMSEPFYDRSTRTNHPMVPSTPSGDVPRSHSATTNGIVFFNKLVSGGPNANLASPPPRQLTSNIPPPTHNQHPFPPSLPLPPLPSSAPMLSLLPINPLRRPNKLRKSNPVSNTPPVLAPLSFIEEPDPALDFEHISHDVQRTSLHPPRASLIPESFHTQDVPQPALCEKPKKTLSLSRRLTKRRRPSLPPIPQAQIVSSSSGAAAAAAIAGNPSAPIAAISQISSPISPGTCHRARSDVGHGVRSSLSMKRSSIIRRFSMRTPNRSLEANRPGPSTNPASLSLNGHVPTSFSSGSVTRWSKWRSAVSDIGHGTEEETPLFLPPVRVTSPFSMKLSSNWNSQDRPSTASIPPVNTTDLNDSSPDSLTPSDAEEVSSPISDDPSFPHARPKFTLEGNGSDSELSNPPSGSVTPATPFALHSAPPPRALSAYTTQFLSPLSRHDGTGNTPTRRRWTFAAAMTDDDITDEALVEELECLRLRHGWGGAVDDAYEAWDADHILFGSQELVDSPEEEVAQQDQLEMGSSLGDPQPTDDPSITRPLPSFSHQRSNSIPPSVAAGSTRHWEKARKVLLTCRELVRTERHYLASLYTLLSSETETAPPPLMLRYAEELVKASEMYLARLEGTPSASGIAAAFIDTEEAIDGAYVGWCGVVGTWFSDEQQETKAKVMNNSSSTNSLSRMNRFSKSGRSRLGGEYLGEKENVENTGKEQEQEDKMAPNLSKSVSSWRRSMTSIADLTASFPSTRKREKNTAPPPSFSVNSFGQRRNGSYKKPLLRDLAILPTQRIMRYVLLYRDLLTHTPSTSPSCPLLERAADTAFRIAQKCDRAQNNSVFILDGRKGSAPADDPISRPSHEGDTNLAPPY